MTDAAQPFASSSVAPQAPWLSFLRRSPGSVVLPMLSFGAAGIHFAVSPDHFAEWVPYGVAFALLAWFQVVWSAAYLVGPSRRLGMAAVAVNAAVIGVWVWSRTIGLPIGPEPGSTEPVGFADALSSGLEVLLVLGLLLGGTGVASRLGLHRARWGVAAAVVAALVVLATLAAMAALAPQPMPMAG